MPAGVINMLPADDGADVGTPAIASPEFAVCTLPDRRRRSTTYGRPSAVIWIRMAPTQRLWAKLEAKTLL